MFSEIKFILSEKGLPKHTLNSKCKEGNLVQSLEEFRVAVNEILTKMIEESGDFSDTLMDEMEEEESLSDDEVDVTQFPKKKRK